MLVQSATLFEFYYTKGDIDILSADKVSNIGDISLPGMLDIGTTYTHPRIRCNAVVAGHTGCAETKANGSWGMFLNLQTTYPNGGWMYFKINNDSYMQLSGSDNKVNIYKDTTISGNSDVSKVLNLQRHPTESDTIPLMIINTSSSGAGFVGKFVSTVKGCLFEYSTSASSTSWWQGILGGSNEFVIKTGSSGLTIKPTGDVSIRGNLDASVSNARTSMKAYNTTEGYTSYIGLEAKWDSQGYLKSEPNKSGANCFILNSMIYIS